MFYAVAVAATLFASLGHICFKKFAVKPRTPIPLCLFDVHLVIGVPVFAASAILGIIALRFIDFSVFYSFTALNYLFISVLSKRFLGEEIDKRKIIGNLIIIVGILVYSLQAM